MNFDDKFDFCLISNPYNGNGKDIIFITASGLDYIDETIISSPSYRKIKSFLEDNNFIEIEFCSFESTVDLTNMEDEIITKLEDRGLRYSKSLEIKINKEVDIINKKMGEPVNMLNNNGMFTLDYDAINPSNKIVVRPTFSIPKVGDKISLYFYLFLQCHFISETDCVLSLNAELQNNMNNSCSNFLRITKSDFVRVESENPNFMVLKSIKKYGDFIKDVSILHRGNFKLIQPFMTEIGQRGYKTKEYKYNFVEIKKSINPDNNILIQIPLNEQYDIMIKRSKDIKREMASIESKKIPISIIKSDIQQIKNNLEHKMIDSAELDEYERASYFKKSITLLNDKLEVINNINEENLTLSDYMKIFTLN